MHLSHLLRVAMLSLLPLLVFPLLLPLAETSMFVYTSTWTDGSVLLVFAGGFIYYACWWWLMLRSYLKLPHAVAITISIIAITISINIIAININFLAITITNVSVGGGRSDVGGGACLVDFVGGVSTRVGNGRVGGGDFAVDGAFKNKQGQ